MTPIVSVLKITILSTMLAGDPGAGVGEWGFAALVEAGDTRLLVDTGARAETVLKNAAELRIDLSTVEELVLTHNHSDHTGGLLTLRKEMRSKNAKALAKAHVGRGIFYPRPRDGEETGGLLPLKAEYEAMGGTFVEHDGRAEIFPGVWLTGPVPRSNPERNWSGSSRLVGPNGLVEDTIPEDASIVVNTPKGLVVVSGCGHAGIVNTLEYARKVVRDAPIVAALGGFHLFAAPDDRLDWTAERLKAMSLRHLVGAHCTGIEAVHRLRSGVGLDRTAAVVGAVGSTFTLDRGIDPLLLAR